MMILLHILIALSSLAVATGVYFKPSQSAVYVSYGLLTATIATGTVLIISSGSHMLESCLMGLAYCGVVSVLTLKARNKLAAQRIRTDKDFRA